LEQVRLRDFCKELSSKGHLFMLSNSDVEGGGETMNKNFLESLYGDFKVDRISVRRHISADPSKRGNISELLIKNYHESPTI
jgi:Site-specific DNA methylase